MRPYPALVLTWPSEPTEDQIGLALATLDDYAPLAVDHTPTGVRVFFSSPATQRAALRAVEDALPDIRAAEQAVSDEDWAERSQAQLTPIQVGNLIVTPPWHVPSADSPSVPSSHPDSPTFSDTQRVVVLPSMGFGTGHHPSTRLCLRLLQKHLTPGHAVLDVGTGSGVLAIAARVRGANRVLGVDTDPDALTNARENIGLNRLDDIDMVVADIGERSRDLTARFDVTFANLTGALLARAADALLGTLRPNGVVIASGYQLDERESVLAAFEAAGGTLIDEATELDWVGGVYRLRPPQ